MLSLLQWYLIGLDAIVGSIMGFEPLVNQRLLPPSFPRYTAIFGRPQVSEQVHVIFNKIPRYFAPTLGAKERDQIS